MEIKINTIRYSPFVGIRQTQQTSVSFGWCEPHVSQRDEVSDELILRMQEELQEQANRYMARERQRAGLELRREFARQEALQRQEQNQREQSTLDNQKRLEERKLEAILLEKQKIREQQNLDRLENLNIKSEANFNITRDLLDFANKQKDEAEFIPLWVVNNNEALKELFNKTPFINDTVQNLISILNIEETIGNNEVMSKERTRKALGVAQINTIVILLEQIKKNKQSNNLSKTDRELVEKLLGMVEEEINRIYSADTLKQLMQLSKSPLKPTDEEINKMKYVMVKIDEKAETIKLSDDYKKVLQELINNQRRLERKRIEIEIEYGRKVTNTQKLPPDFRRRIEDKLKTETNEARIKASELALELDSAIEFSSLELTPQEIKVRKEALEVKPQNTSADRSPISINVSMHEHPKVIPAKDMQVLIRKKEKEKEKVKVPQ